jgi:hypothetical protein
MSFVGGCAYLKRLNHRPKTIVEKMGREEGRQTTTFACGRTVSEDLVLVKIEPRRYVTFMLPLLVFSCSSDAADDGQRRKAISSARSQCPRRSCGAGKEG